MRKTMFFVLALFSAAIVTAGDMKIPAIKYPAGLKADIVDTIFGTPVPDPYRPLENYQDPEVQAWLAAEEKIGREILDQLPERSGLYKRLTELRRYDDESAPSPVPNSLTQ